MKIVLTHPFCWPYVRRGTERGMDVLAHYLVNSGHEVTTVSTRPGGSGTEKGSSGTRILRRPLTLPFMGALRIKPTHTFFFTSVRALRKLDADVVHSFYPADALAAIYTKRRHGHRTVLQMNGIAIPGVSCYRWLPPEGAMFREALRRADARIACSGFVRDLLRDHYGVDAVVIPPPTRLEAFDLGQGPLDGRPILFAAADFDVRRKGVRALLKAFAIVKRAIPRVRLKLSGKMSARLGAELLHDLPNHVAADVELLGLGAVEDLPRLYGEASVTVLPAMWEPSGTVLVESLAAGTPVVATNHGGIPEFVTPEVGVLFDPETEGEETHNAIGLADAILQGVSLSEKEGTRAACRRHALRYGWPAAGPRIERVYRGDLN
jgi:glycosyltransferase involved in cell wall biosynthesis